MRRLALLSASVLALALSTPSIGQYLYLDSNGDGINTVDDRIAPAGENTLDIWIVTDRNRDGSPASCAVDPETPLTINSWEVVLRAVGGRIAWGPLKNRLPLTGLTANFASGAEDTLDPVIYHNGWGGRDILPPGRYHLGRMTLRVISGEPSIRVLAYSPAQAVDLTSFGTKCVGFDFDNTYKLGLEWSDADGVGSLTADAGGPYVGAPGGSVLLDGSESHSPQDLPLTYAWDFGDGTAGAGAQPRHVYAEVGLYRLILVVSDGTREDADTTEVNVLPNLAPVADAGGPYYAPVSRTVYMRGDGSSDPNGDALAYSWSFGDGRGGTGKLAAHAYAAVGTYVVTLTVSDGLLSDSDETIADITPAAAVPVAVAGGPYGGVPLGEILFDGSGSFDSDGDPLRFHWIFGDGSIGSGERVGHAYELVGIYEVILEVSDGYHVASDVTYATVAIPAGAPPIAHAGGPYRGVAGQPVRFDASGSYDPDGGGIEVWWRFGDGRAGSGVVCYHTFHEAGLFQAEAIVSDGAYFRTSSARVEIAPALRARAFLEGGGEVLPLRELASQVRVRIEPIGLAFDLDEIRTAELLVLDRAAESDGILAGEIAAGGSYDSDGNGVREVAVLFDAHELQSLLRDHGAAPRVAIAVRGGLGGGEGYAASMEWIVRADEEGTGPIIRPNPFNPVTTISYWTTKSGPVTARLYDVRGRLVRTLLAGQWRPAGSHDLILDAAAGAQGPRLASGLYYLVLRHADGAATRRLTVAR